jgi:phage terminase large subunit-like protein
MALKCYYDFNPPSKRHWTYQQFIEKRDPITHKAVSDEFNYAFMLMNPEDNKTNLSPEYIRILEELPPKAKQRFLYGQFADDSDGSLWTEELLESLRVDGDKLPGMVRIVIAVDPSGCSGEEDYRSDEVGIVVVGLGTDGHGYLFEDLSGRFGPRDWARITNSAYHRHEADRVVAEKNYGGEMVKSTLEAENSILPVTLVHASRGKIVRAEPISQLYERGLVHHVGHFPEIEDQMMSFTTSGYQGMKSPDRADAVVWALTELFPSIAQFNRGKVWVPPAVVTRPRSASAYNRTKRYAGKRR